MKMFARSEKFNEGETIKADAIGATDKPRRCGGPCAGRVDAARQKRC